MSRLLIPAVALYVLCGAALTAAQTPEDEVRSAWSHFVEVARAPEREALADVLHERFVGRFDVDGPGGVMDAENAIQWMLDDPMPANITVAEPDIAVWGPFAHIVAPVDLAAGGAPAGIGGQVIALLVKTDEHGWQVLSAGLSVTVGPDATLPADAVRMYARIEEAFEESLSDLLADAAQGKQGALLGLLHPDAAMAFVTRGEGEVVVMDTEAYRNAVAGLPEVPMTTREEDRLIVPGAPLALISMTADAQPEGRGRVSMRTMAVFAWCDAPDGWQIIATAQAPLEEAGAP